MEKAEPYLTETRTRDLPGGLEFIHCSRFAAHAARRGVGTTRAMARAASAERKLTVYPRTSKRGRGPSCIDLFSGAGGLAVGFRQAGWSVLAANDADVEAGKTFRLNFPEATFFEGPISKLKADALMKECGLKPGELDCLIGGPPCQSFSYNNHQRSADDTRAKLFRDYLRLVAALQPKSLVMENVPGILTIGDNAVVDEIGKKLVKLGYKLAMRVLSAEEFGTPQTRRRVFIVASRTGNAEELLPKATHRAAKAADDRSSKLLKPVTVGDAIGDLPTIRNGGGEQVADKPRRKPSSDFQRDVRKGSTQVFNHICHELTVPMLKRIKHVPEGGNWRNIPRRLLTDGMKRARKSDHTKRYGRLSRKGLASTLLTKCDPHWGAYIHPTQNRTISVREAARLQGFPDTFQFAGNGSTAQYVQVGNAVPVPLARAIGAAAAKHIKKAKKQAVSKLKAKKSTKRSTSLAMSAAKSRARRAEKHRPRRKVSATPSRTMGQQRAHRRAA